MMTSVGGSRPRGNWEQTQGQTQSQSQHKQRPQATAEQIRLAQMISDHNDADFEEKVKQLVDITGKDQDESMIALHDCNGDVNRAINVLLEGSPDTDSWEMVGKKKGVSGQKESTQTEGGDEGKENRERGGERDVARRRGGAPRRGRGASRGREFRGQENGLDGAKASGVAGRGTERGRRGRGRGRGGAGRRGGRFSAQGMGQIDKGPRYDLSGDESTFNPADYTEPAQTEESYTSGSTWSNTGNLEPEDGNRLEFTGGEGTNYPRKFDSAPGAWRTATEEWGTEDWNEDLSETKIFTASSVASMPIPQENVTITAGQRIDLAVLLGKTPPSSSSEAEPASLEGPQPPSLSQSLVFSNSKQTASLSQTSSAPYSQHSMVSMLSKGFGDVGDPKGTTGGSTTGSQFLEQFKTAQALAQLAAQHSQSGPSNTGPSTWDTSPTTLGQYDMKPQTEPVHSPFTKRQPYQPASTSSSMMDAFLQDKATPTSTTSALLPQSTQSSSLPQAVTTPVPKISGPTPGQQNSSSPADPQASSPLPLQQHKLKQQKKRASITTKIPALAVEMPGSADISGLNLQFGALQFGSEPVLPEYDASAAVATTTPGNQGQNSLYTSASNEQATALSNPSQMELYEPRASQTRRYPPSVSSSPQKDMQPKNGFSSIQTSQSLEAAAGSAVPMKPASESVVPPSVSSIASLADPSSGPPSLLTTSNQTPLSALGHEDASSSSLAPPQHNNSLPTQQNSLAPSSVRTSNTSLLHPSVDADSSLHSSSFSSVSVAPSSVPPPSSATSAAPISHSVPVAPSSSVSSVSVQSALGPSSLTMGLNSAAGVASMVPPPVAASSSAASATVAPSSASSSRSTAASGKAPPNLPPGVPPLLPNPYIMAPGLLHPYPPQVYGYDDLQMLQTRIPLDYYSIPFATPTTALTGREGSLTSNPYSAGDLSKFGRGDASSPAPATTLAQPQQTQTQTHHTTQQPFLNPALPPGYSYTSLPYYTGVPGLPNTFQYGPAMFPVAPTSSKQHGVNVGVNASATPFQQASGYGSHGYSTGYEDLGQASAGSGDFCKGGYGTAVAAAAAAAAAASAQNKPASSVTGPGVGVSVTSSNTGVPDISGSVYTKTQSFEKQGFHTGTPSASFSLPSALGSGGPINPPAAAGYAPAPYMHILTPHQQPHSQMLHHHLQQDGQSGSGQRSQNASIQQKSQINKSGYNSYNWGGN
ncbi:ubiquitin-associated protein 2-like isoform X1 [Ctenopharyngodon idella]|uniref:ubiquitin-associated protein 2-like isoform X1 n=1 Tax=Ctenopharyngodon idella TaxID=7959 RepID=UPI0022311DDC|nr:ubiquitin-associated protein 2-like isoform X1 [Ctenopharyngodon idella]XP_051728055.1 ubiquitin-associated protein 2-like isoform X1 [Ctenopharyngodon idella]XP_051728056.1 ubiquitin-associated protein 2-like isoform X1 [Ctenopharyngodon idella]